MHKVHKTDLTLGSMEPSISTQGIHVCTSEVWRAFFGNREKRNVLVQLKFPSESFKNSGKDNQIKYWTDNKFTHMHECKLTVPCKMLQSSLQHIATYQTDQDAEVQGQSDLVYYLLQ